MKRIIQSLCIGLLSAGWIFPGYLAISYQWRGNKLQIADEVFQHSFPYFAESQRMLGISAIYLFVVISFWGFYAFRKYGK